MITKELNIEDFDHFTFESADGVVMKFIHMKEKGWTVGKHVHSYDHTTLLAKGSVVAFVEGEETKEYFAPATLLVKKGKKHCFMALEDDTRMFCIHNTLSPNFNAQEIE